LFKIASLFVGLETAINFKKRNSLQINF